MKDDQKKWEITWYADDGYIGHDRPQSIEVSTDDFFNNSDAIDIEQQLEGFIEEDFREKITWDYTADLDTIAQEIYEAIQQEEKGER